MAVQIQLRNDTTINWATNNPVLALGEFGLDTDLKQFKIGNGVDVWNNLPYGGIEGLSAYEVALANGFVGTEVEWLASLQGEQGIQGEQGLQGIQGIQGEKGDTGEQGEEGLSVYEVALANGFVGTEQEWLDSLKNIEYLVQPITAISYVDSGNSVVDCSLSNTFTLTADGTGTTITQTNIPTGKRYGFELHLNWVSGTITWSASWNKGDSLPTVVGDYVITGVTIDGGTSWKIAILVE